MGQDKLGNEIIKNLLSTNSIKPNPSLIPNLPTSNSPIGLGNSKYDEGITTQNIGNLNEIRASRQSWFNQLGSMVARGTAKGIISLGYTPAVLGDILKINHTAEDFDNKMVKSLDDAMKSVDEAMPEYSRYLEGSEKFRPWSWDFLMSNFDSVIESAIGFGIPGGIIGGSLTKAGKIFGMSTKLAKTFGAVPTAYIMNHVEGMREATQVYSDMVEQGLSPEDAAKAADEVVWNNKINLLFEIPQTLMLLRGFKHSTSNANIDKSWLRTRGLDLGKQFVPEFLEEVNTGYIVSEAERTALIGKYTKDLANPKLDDFEKIGIQSKLDDLNKNDSKLSRYFDYMLSDQGLTEGFIGGLGGVATDVVGSNAANVFAKIKGQPTENTRKALGKELISKNAETVRTIFNKSSKVYEDMMDAASRNDEEVFNMHRDKLLVNQAYANMNLGTFKQFRDTVESTFDMTEDEAIANDLDHAELQTMKQSTLAKLDKMESIYNKTQNKYEGYSTEVQSKIFETNLSLAFLPEYIKSVGNKINTIYSDAIINGTEYSASHLDLNKTLNLSKIINEKLADASLPTAYKLYLEKQKIKVDALLKNKLDLFNSVIIDTETDSSYYDNLPNKKSSKIEDFEIASIDDSIQDLTSKQLEFEFMNEKTIEQYKELTDTKNLDRLEEQVQAEKEQLIKDARDKAVKQAKDKFSESVSKAKTLAELDNAFKEFKNSKESGFKNLSKKEQAEINKQFSQTRADFIKNNKSNTTTNTNTNTGSTTNTNTGNDTNNTNTGNKAETSEDQPNKSEEDIDKLNKSQGDDTFKKKSAILSFAWLNVNYTKDAKGAIVDVYDEEGNLQFNPLRDWRLLDYDRLFNGDEIEIFIDTEYATANGIPIDKNNLHRIPYGIRFKGSNLTAAYIHAFTNPITSSIDPTIERFIADKNTHGTQQNLLNKLRNNLFEQLSKNPKDNVISAKISDISKGALALSKDWAPSSTRLAEDTIFGIVNSNGTIDIINSTSEIESKYVTTYNGTEFPIGSVVAMLPSYAKQEQKIILVPSILKTEMLTEEDIDIAIHIIQNFENYSGTTAQNIFGVKGDDILNNIVFNGKNTTKFKIDKTPDGTRYLYTSKSGSNWNTAVKDLINVNDTAALKAFLQTQRYNVQNKDYIKFKVTKDNDGKITKVEPNGKTPINEWMLTHTSTNINSFNIKDNNGTDTGRKGYFVQPVISFETTSKSSSTSTKSNNTSNTSNDIETKKAELEKLNKEKEESLKPLIEEKEKIEKEIDEIENTSKSESDHKQGVDRLLSQDISEKSKKIIKAFARDTTVSFEYIAQKVKEMTGDIITLDNNHNKLDSLQKIAETQNEENLEKEYNDKLEQSGIILEQEYSVEETSKILENLGGLKGQTKLIWNLIRKVAEQLGVKIIFSNKQQIFSKLQAKGIFYLNENKIYVNIGLLRVSTDAFYKTTVHELVHGVTRYIVKIVNSSIKSGVAAVGFENITKKQIQAVRNLNNVLEELKKDENFKSEYGITDIDELLAELSNEDFVQKLKSKKFSGNKSFFNSIVSFITDILGLDVSAYDIVYESLEVLIETPSIEALNKSKSIGKESDFSRSATKLSQLKQRLNVLNKKIDDVTKKFNRLILQKQAEIAKLETTSNDIEKRRQELESSREIETFYDVRKPITEDSKETIDKINKANELRAQSKNKSNQAKKETDEDTIIALNSQSISLNESAKKLDNEIIQSRNKVIESTPIKQAIVSAWSSGTRLLNKIKLAAKSNEWVPSMPISKEDFIKFEDVVKKLAVKNMGEVTSNSEVTPWILLAEELTAKLTAKLTALEATTTDIEKRSQSSIDTINRIQKILDEGLFTVEDSNHIIKLDKDGNVVNHGYRNKDYIYTPDKQAILSDAHVKNVKKQYDYFKIQIEFLNRDYIITLEKLYNLIGRYKLESFLETFPRENRGTARLDDLTSYLLNNATRLENISKQINAKYDIEIAALETTTSQTKEEANIIQTNKPNIQTVGNVTFGTANKQGQTDNNEDAVYVDTQNGIFILADGMGGEGMITLSPAQASQSVINKLLGKLDKNATELLYEEYLKNKNITSNEAVSFLNKNGFNIKRVGTSMVSTIINSFKTKGDLTNKKGFRSGATALKAVKTGKNTYTIEKVGDTVFFVVDKNGKVIKQHGLSDVATTQGYMFSIRDGKPFNSSPKIDNFTITLNEGETLVLSTDFIETDKAIQDFIDSDFGKNLNIAKFQKENKTDDSTFITIKYDAEIAKLETTTTPQTETSAKPRQKKSKVVDETLLSIEAVQAGDLIGNTNAQPNISISEETQKLLDVKTQIQDNRPVDKLFTNAVNILLNTTDIERYDQITHGGKIKDYYSNEIDKKIAKLKDDNTHNLNSELTNVNPATAAEVSRIATAENKYQAVGEIVLQSNDEELNSIMFKVFDALNGKEPRISFHFENNNNVARYDGSIHTVSINKATVAKSKRALAYVLAHELIHAATVNKLKVSSNRVKFQPLFDIAKSKLGSNPKYRRAFKNIEEFVAEAFSNTEFKKDLQSIKVDNRNWFTKFIDFIKGLFGYTADTTFLYDLVYKNTEELLASSESEFSEDSFDLYDNFLVPGLTVYQTEEMLKSISYIRIQALRKNKNTTEKDLDLIVKNEINKAYNKILDVDSNDSRLDLFDVVIGVNETEADDFNNDTYKKLTERSKAYIKRMSDYIREDNRVWDETTDEEATDVDELNDDENTTSESKERVYDKSPFEDNPKDSASKRLKSYLATQPKVAFTPNKENIYIVGNMYNMASTIPFDVLYNTLVDNLANTPTDKIFDKLELLSKYNPQIKKIYNELKQFRESGDLDKVAIYKEFISNFSTQKTKFITSQFTKFGANNSYRVIYSNRNNSQSILIDQWHNNFKYNTNDITKVVKGETVVDKQKAEALYKEFKDYITFNKDTKVTEANKIVKAIELLNRIGISLSSDEISSMLTTNPTLVEKDYTVKKFLNSAEYIIKSLSSKQIITDEDSDLQRLNDNPFIGAESKNLLSLAKIELTVSNNLFSTMFRNEQGKSISSNFKNNVISKIFQEMFDTTSTIYKNMEKSAFHSNSWIFNQIKKGLVTANNFEIDVFSTINERYKAKGVAKTFKEMTAKERLINKIIMYTNEGQSKAYYQFPTLSDKTWVPILGMNRVEVNVANGKVNNEVLEAFYSIFSQEMYRIIDVKDFYANNERFKMIENYHVSYDKELKKEVLGFGGKFIFLPTFNSDNVTVTIGTGDVQVERPINDLNANEFELEEVKAQILDKLNGEVLELIEKEREDLVKNGILHENGVLLVKDKSISKGANKDHFGTNFVANYAVNYALAYNSIYTLFNNDPAFAKDWSDIIKRGAMNSAPGSDLTNNGTFGAAIIKDKKTNSTALKELIEVLPSLTDTKTADKITSALTDIEYTDAQAWCSLKHYRSFLSGLGRLTDRVDKIITALEKDQTITSEDISELMKPLYDNNFVLQPQKPVYVYDTWDPVSNTLVRRYLKYSVFPLFKQLTKDHPELDALRKKIDAPNSRIELVIAKSAVKEGAQFVTEAEDISNDTIIDIPWKGLSLQQETPYDKNKMKINTVSQARKLLFGDLLEFNLAFKFNGNTYQTKELKSIFDSLFKASIKEEYEKLLSDLKINEDGNITDLTLIRDLLAEEGIRKDYDQNFLESLKVENNKFNIPLWISTYSDQIESLLTSIITNRIVKQKMPGRSFVQGSPFGFSKENIVSTSSKRAMAALKGMGISNDKVTDEGIYLPNIFDGLEGFKTGDILTEEMLKVVGFRIPNQGHNSMANLKIAGFLPKEVGDLVIVSPDMLVRMGSDFDVDKLYLYIKNAKRVYKEGRYYITPYTYNDNENEVDVRYKDYLEEAKGKILSFEEFSQLSIERQNSKKARQNAIIDIYMEILSKKELAPRIMRPNDIKELEEANNKVLELQGKNQNPDLNLLSPSAQDEMFESNIAGKTAVGTTSLWSTFLAQVQYYENFGIRIYKQLKDGKVLVNEGVKFKDDKGNLYNDGLVLYKDSSGNVFTEEQAKEVDYKNLVQLENIGLHKVNKVKGVVNNSFISDIIQILQSAAVDNSKEQQMTKGHINDMTLNPAMFMAMSGVDSLPMIISFIAQPSIVKYVKSVQASNSITATFTSEKAEDTEYLKIVKDIQERIGKLGGTFTPLTNEWSVSAFSLKELEDALVDNKNFTNENFNNQQKVVYLQRQYEILHAFKYYSGLAQNMNSIINNMNVDTKSIGKNFIEVSAKNDKIQLDILGNSNFIGVDELWKDSIPGMIYELAIAKSLSIYNDPNLYPTLNFIKFAVDKLKAFKGLKSSDSLSNKDLEGIKRAANHFVTNTINGLFSEESVTQTRNRLINGNNTIKPLHERLLEYQKESIVSNWLLQVLSVDPNTNAISYPSVKIEGDDTVYAIASLVELLNSDDPNVKVFAEDLIKYSFLTSGNNKSKGGLSNIIPIEYLLEKQFGEYYNNDMFIKSLNNPDISNRFLDQYVRNNPTAAFRLDDNVIFSNVNGVLKIEENILLKKAGHMPKYVYVFNKDKKGEVTLFGLIGTEDVGKITEVNYQALNRLNSEYSLAEDLMLSVYKNNNKFDPFLISDSITLSDNKDDTMIVSVEPTAEQLDLFSEPIEETTPIISNTNTNTGEITYNPQQQNAIEKVFDFIDNGNPNEYFVIEGKAGTGKTTIAQEIAKKYEYKNISVAALSHKAKNVIKTTFDKANLSADFNSLASLLGMKLDMETGIFRKENKKGFEIDPPITNADIIIIDEASMINEEAINLIFEYKDPKAKVIFLGDIGQLPPIRSENNPYYSNKKELINKKSSVFNTTNKAVLTERVRQGEESPILPFADYFWENSQSKKPVENPITERTNIITKKGALLFSNSFNEIKNNVLDSFKNAVTNKNPNHIKVVTYRNATRETINKWIHDNLFGQSSKDFNEGELIIFNDSYDDIENSTETQVTKASEVFTDKDGLTFINISAVVNDKLQTFPVITNKDKVKYSSLISEMFKDAFALPKGTYEYKVALANAWAFKNKYANVDYGYAITSHKSQGSTYDIVVVNEKDIMGVTATTNENKSESVYTALTRARNISYVISTVKTEAADINIEELNTTINANKKGTVSNTTESPTVTPTTKKPGGLAGMALSKKQAGELSNTTPTEPVVKKSLVSSALRRDQISSEDLNNKDRTIKVEQFNITIKPDGKMFYDNGNEVTDQTTKNKVNVRKELQDGTLRTSTYNGSNYFILSDNRIVGSGTTNLGKESINNVKTKETILATAIKYKPNCK
jgi:hypothetical protein